MTLKGYVDHFLYFNEGNGYGVFELNTEKEDVICTGYFPGLNQGALVLVSGEMVVHPQYGDQMNVTAFEEQIPTGKDEIERYLATAIKGVGKSLAKRIVKKFGDDTLRILEEEPERLQEVKGIGEGLAMDIGAQVEAGIELRASLIFLQKYNISSKLALKLYRKYGSRVRKIICENPYRLAEDIEGIGFRRADEIALTMGIKIDEAQRLKSGMVYVLNLASQEGHTFLPLEILLDKASQMLGVERKLLETELPNLAIEGKINIRTEADTTICQLPFMYKEELASAVMLRDLNITEENTDRKELEDDIDSIIGKMGCTLDQKQREAVILARENTLLILTGGPGTGKTTTINVIIKYFESKGLSILLGAPTGRAAKRMTEATGVKAATIHRMLELKGTSDTEENKKNIVFQRNSENPLEADVIIIDECSMVDIHLFYNLLKAITPGTRLILVGDENQLPSVGPGQVLKDLIQSNIFRYVELTKIYRQKTGSDIVDYAHRINRGEIIPLDTKSPDFLFLERNDVEQLYRHMLYFAVNKLPAYVEADMLQVQILTPTRKGPLGAPALNKVIQNYMNPPEKGKAEYQYRDVIFREGDKVMQNKNNYELEWEILGINNIRIDSGVGIFNGDCGIIREIDCVNRYMRIEFDERRMVTLSFDNLEELELSYAITIHKSQGSEYPAVIMPLLGGPPQLLNRNLLYTGVTRASRLVMILGSSETVKKMIRNENERTRYTGLVSRIREVEG